MEYTFNQYLDEKIEEKEGIHIISIGPGCNNSISYETNTLCYEELLGVIGVILSNNITEFDLVLIDPVLPQITDTSNISKIVEYLKSYYLMDNYTIVENKKRLECYICQGDIRNHILVNIYLFNESLPIILPTLQKGGGGNGGKIPIGKETKRWCDKLKTLIELKKNNYGSVIVQNFVKFRLPRERLNKREQILSFIFIVLFQHVFDKENYANHKLLLSWTGYFIDSDRHRTERIPPFFLFERFMYLERSSSKQIEQISNLKNFTPLTHFPQRLNFINTLQNNIFIPYTYNLVGENIYSIPAINSYDTEPPIDNRLYLREHLNQIIDQLTNSSPNKTKSSRRLNDLVETSFQTYQMEEDGKITLIPLLSVDNLQIPKEYTHLVKCEFDSETKTDDEDSESSGYWYGKY